MTCGAVWVTTGLRGGARPGTGAGQALGASADVLGKETSLARNQYSFEKRRREIAKQKKKEEKRQRKLEKKNPQPEGESEAETMPLDGNAETPTVEEERPEPPTE